MARPIQRGKKDKAKPKPKSKSKPEPTSTVKITDKSISGSGENQNVNQITIKIENPKPPPKPKPKPRKRAKKKDTAKEEAIEELKEELANYDEVQTQAGQLGIELPAELGVSPSEASALKNVDDIRSFIMIVKEKRGKISELVQLKANPRPQPQQQISGPSPNRFTPSFAINRAGLPAPTVDIAPAPQQQASGQSSAIDRQLDDLDREQQKEALKIKRSTSIEKFREKNVKTENIILTIKANVDTARMANNGVLTVSQLDTFITSYEQAMTRYNTGYAELSPQTQTIMKPQREELFAELSAARKLLVDEKRGLEATRGIPQLLPPPKKTWSPTNSSGMAMLNEYITIDMDTTEITPAQAQTMMTTLRSLKNPVLAEGFYTEIGNEPDAKKRQSIIREVIQSRVEDENEKPKGIPLQKSDWQPKAKSGRPFLREFIRVNPLRTQVTSAQQRQLINALREIEPPLVNSFITEIQNDKSIGSQQRQIRSVLQSRMKDAQEDEKLLRDATEQEKQAAKAEQADIVQEEVDAEKEASKQQAKGRLLGWLNDEQKKGYINWGDKLIKDMQTLGATSAQISNITKMNTKQQKKQGVRYFLASPAERCKPGRRSGGTCVPPPRENDALPMASSRTKKPEDTSSARGTPAPSQKKSIVTEKQTVPPPSVPKMFVPSPSRNQAPSTVPMSGRFGRTQVADLAPSSKPIETPIAKPTPKPTPPPTPVIPKPKIILTTDWNEFYALRKKHGYGADKTVVIKSPEETALLAPKPTPTPTLKPKIILTTDWNEFYALRKKHGYGADKTVVIKSPEETADIRSRKTPVPEEDMSAGLPRNMADLSSSRRPTPVGNKTITAKTWNEYNALMKQYRDDKTVEVKPPN